ncbi:MAG: hypothetical protein AB1665_04395 [Candidatus Thermoplasmatota archaeon]
MATGAISHRFESWTRNNAWWLLPCLFALSAAVLALGALGGWYDAYKKPPMLSPLAPLNGWSYWLILLGGLGAFAFGIYLSSQLKNRSELLGYLRTESRAKFKANLDRIEELAWRLGGKYERIVLRRKEEFGL